MVRALMDRGLACFQGKSELPGKPMQYGTTRKFLEIFGLRNLKELPSLEEIDQLLPDGIGYDEEEETLSDVTDSLSEAVGEKYSQGEEELGKIVEKLDAIDTSSEFFETEKRRQKEKKDRDRARDIREARDLGDEVPKKDLRWLDRYEAKQAEAAEIQATAEESPGENPEGANLLADAQSEEEAFAALGNADEGSLEEESLQDQLQGLTAESQPLEDQGEEVLEMNSAGLVAQENSGVDEDSESEDIGEPINGMDA